MDIRRDPTRVLCDTLAEVAARPAWVHPAQGLAEFLDPLPEQSQALALELFCLAFSAGARSESNLIFATRILARATGRGPKAELAGHVDRRLGEDQTLAWWTANEVLRELAASCGGEGDGEAVARLAA